MLRQTPREGRYSRFILSYLFLEAILLVSCFPFFWVCLFLVAKVVFHFLLIQFLNQALK